MGDEVVDGLGAAVASWALASVSVFLCRRKCQREHDDRATSSVFLIAVDKLCPERFFV